MSKSLRETFSSTWKLKSRWKKAPPEQHLPGCSQETGPVKRVVRESYSGEEVTGGLCLLFPPNPQTYRLWGDPWESLRFTPCS